MFVHCFSRRCAVLVFFVVSGVCVGVGDGVVVATVMVIDNVGAIAVAPFKATVTVVVLIVAVTAFVAVAVAVGVVVADVASASVIVPVSSRAMFWRHIR